MFQISISSKVCTMSNAISANSQLKKLVVLAKSNVQKEMLFNCVTRIIDFL